MNIAYCSLLLPEEKNLSERAKGHLSGISLHKFTRAIISGLDANSKKPVRIFNIINTLNYPKFPDLIFPTEEWSHTDEAKDIHIGYINLFGIKYLTQEKNLYRALDQWFATLGGTRAVLCVHHNYYPMMKAALRIKRKYGNQAVTCLISGDIPGKFGLKSQYKDSLKQKMIERMEKSILQMAKQFDSFVLQTQYMAEGFGVADKPVCVLECTYLPKAYTRSDKAKTYNPDNKKVVFYAGSLRKEYDAIHLLNAFRFIQGDEFEFWLAGGGNAVEEIQKAAETDNRIKFLGFISPQEVYDRQQVATVLVSPRKSNHVFVKYSFPSKTMECLASGKPYIAHRLPCEPDEYGDFIQYPDNETDEALANKIVEICNTPDAERRQMGEKGREFILTQKNPKAMCRRVLEFWETLLEEPC